MKHFMMLLVWSLLLCVAGAVRAEVTRVDITHRTDVLNGRVYANAGAYEWLHGRAHFTLDPAHARNQAVVDIALAPKNAKGLIEYSADLVILQIGRAHV